MSSEKFVNALRVLAPTKEDFLKYSVSDEYIANFINRYICFQRPNEALVGDAKSEVLILLRKYNCATIAIGNLSFANEAIEFEDYYQVGNVEIDVLALNKITLEIEVRDHDSPSHIIWLCASNGNNFLDALIVCAEHLKSIFKNPSLDDNNSYVLNIVNLCAEKAGGEQYLDFYKMLLGYFE